VGRKRRRRDGGRRRRGREGRRGGRDNPKRGDGWTKRRPADNIMGSVRMRMRKGRRRGRRDPPRLVVLGLLLLRLVGWAPASVG